MVMNGQGVKQFDDSIIVLHKCIIVPDKSMFHRVNKVEDYQVNLMECALSVEIKNWKVWLKYYTLIRDKKLR